MQGTIRQRRHLECNSPRLAESIDSQSITSYWCYIVTSCLCRTVVELLAASQLTEIHNKAVTDRRLRPRCCHRIRLREAVSCVRRLQRVFYARFIAKPKDACELRVSRVAKSSSLGLCANMTSSIKPQVRNISLRRQRRTEPQPYVTCTKNREDRTCSSEDIIADRQTHTDRQTRSSQYSAPLSARATTAAIRATPESTSTDATPLKQPYSLWSKNICTVPGKLIRKYFAVFCSYNTING